ncbi:MAG TPA: HAD family hydrolase [Spirochaetia bacterium]|nr:HAD family hydrolase [Spirochaetia bacterium]
MKLFQIPDPVGGLLFDIDMTLYDSRAYIASQRSTLIERLALELGKPVAETDALVDTHMRDYAAGHGGRLPSLGNTFLAMGIPIQRSVEWREQLFRPEEYLSEDENLRDSLKQLSERYPMAAVTNNPSSIGRRTLRALGVEDLFALVIGLDTSGVSKPGERPFQMARECLSLPFGELISIGDRFEVDLEVPLKLGMGAILIEAMEDVYRLPEILLQ